MKTAFGIVYTIFLLSFLSAHSHDLTQVIRGNIVDSESLIPLPFANISVTSLSTPLGTTSDTEQVQILELTLL